MPDQDKAAKRTARLAAALRQNLHRRKAEARAADAPEPETPEDARRES